MIKSLRKIGNSQGILIDKTILELLNIDENASFDVQVNKNGIHLRPISKRISEKSHTPLNKPANK
jgi:antitoxin component of MazEF toxin-antitoxin module